MKHRDEVLALLKKQIGNDQEVADIETAANEVAGKWVNPVSGGSEAIKGLVYGLVQSGKTGVLSVSGAVGADEGYRTIVILTSDNDALYAQTLARVQEAFPGIDILAKDDCRDQDAFIQRVKSGTCAIVVTKNSNHLKSVIQNFKKGNLKGLSCLLIDDEADQASLNTFASKDDGRVSGINRHITDLRSFFEKNTYLQVTATPQALFLQSSDHPFRPQFTVLSHPGRDYIGGDDFFGEGSTLVREFSLEDITALTAGGQPSPTLKVPVSLMLALDTFIVGATYKRLKDPEQNCAFLCHVSTRKADHRHIVGLLREYKADLQLKLKKGDPVVLKRLKTAYDDLANTHVDLKSTPFDKLAEAATFFSPGITVKLVNGETDEDVALRSPYNLFVGGNKLGRGVTIKNLIVSYYGRNPRTPQADTVLQHARMYGYRRKDIGLLRLFLPPQLHVVFRSIYSMEKSLRELIRNNPDQEFRGIFLEGRLKATRRTVLVPGAIGVYTGGGNYNPAQILRSPETAKATAKLDALLSTALDKSYVEMPIPVMQELIELILPDPDAAEGTWNSEAVAGALEKYATIFKKTTGYVFVARKRDLRAVRRETAGVLAGGEGGLVPNDKPTLFMLRSDPYPGAEAAWWPQFRLPNGNYGFAFSV